jgi:hypothetical protein
LDLNVRKILTITLPATAITGVLLMAGAEVWVRATLDPLKGRPGFFVGDPMRRQRLAANYTGWFAGVPVHINSLELRDDREYDLRKGSKTFRVLVLGDSVTFGHGAVSENTYPAILERRLRAWRPDVDWQVWNAAVPGYNTSQELAHLLEVGPTFTPDLVVIGFYPNDIVDNYAVVAPGRLASAQSAITSFLRRHVYSLELYRKVFLTLAWKLSRSDEFQKRLDHLGTEDSLLDQPSRVSRLPEQNLTHYDRYSDDEVKTHDCEGGQTPNPVQIRDMQSAPGWPVWVRAVRELQQLHRTGQYSILFFLNEIPLVCPDGDFFYAKAVQQENDLFLRIMGDGTPAVSALDAFLHVRPSQMPQAIAHAIGNSNAVKADTLFRYLTSELFPRLHHPALAEHGQPQP